MIGSCSTGDSAPLQHAAPGASEGLPASLPEAILTASVVDSAYGRPAEGVEICLQRRITGEWQDEARARTDEGGLAGLLPARRLTRGVYKLEFDVGSYFAGIGKVAFHPSVIVVFQVTDPDQQHHIPVLITPYSHLTYQSTPPRWP